MVMLDIAAIYSLVEFLYTDQMSHAGQPRILMMHEATGYIIIGVRFNTPRSLKIFLLAKL